MNRHTEVEVLSLKEQKTLIDWITNNWNCFIFNKNNYGHFMYIQNLKNNDANENIYLILNAIREKIIKLEGIVNAESHLFLQDFIYYMKPGTKLHRHMDENENNHSYHIRFNVLLQAPEKGGVPVYAGKKIKTKERCYIVCRSGMDFHSGTEIIGNKCKIVLSYGFNIEKKDMVNYPTIFPEIIDNSNNVIACDYLKRPNSSAFICTP